MKKASVPLPINGVRKAYRKPWLTKHGPVAKITLKAGSAFDVMTQANDMQR